MNKNYIIKAINNYKSSEEYSLMVKGDNYYKVKNDIRNRVITRYLNNVPVEDKGKVNNKISHGVYKNLVDEKVSYILGKDFTLEGDKKIVDYLEAHKEMLIDMAYDITNHGKAWLHICYNEKGELVLVPFLGLNIIPIWNMYDKNKLDALIRFYTIELIDENGDVDEIEKIEVWYEDRIEFYVNDGKTVILDSEEYIKRGIKDEEPCGHFSIGGNQFTWGTIPFVCFRNNRVEANDLSFIKDLVDNYDLSRSDVANYLQECQNLIYVLKNYCGQDLAEFVSDLSYYRAIKVDEDGGVETLTPTVETNALNQHYEQLKRDIIEFGQGVYKDLDNLGGNVSGITLKMLYTSLELKTDIFGKYFVQGINQLSKLIGMALSVANTEIKITFNKDIAINETEVIENALKSTSLLSKETILKNHPWVVNVDEELEKINANVEENLFSNIKAEGDTEEV